MEATPGDSQHEDLFLDDSESQLLPRRELVSGMQGDDDDAGFVTPVPPPCAPPMLAAAETLIPAPLYSEPASVCLTAVASQESSSLEYLSMQVGKQKTDCLNFSCDV
jgi:hypothetical protein